MARRPTSTPSDTDFDDLRRQAVLDPTGYQAYGQLAAQHFGSLEVGRLRPLLRRVELLFGKTAATRRLDAVFERLESAGAVKQRSLGVIPVASHAVRIAGRTIRFVADDPAAMRFVKANLVAQWPYEVGVMRYLLRRLEPDDVFVDVGAHAGFFSLIATSLGAVAFAIEPQRDLIRVIDRNAAINGADRLHAMNLAVSDRDGLTSILRVGGSPGTQVHGELVDAPHATAQNRHVDWVPTARLDSLCRDPAFRPKLVKIDVEGFEMRVLAGATRLISEAETAFVVELHPQLLGRFDGELATLLGHFGSPAWRVLELSGDPPQPTTLADGIARAEAVVVDGHGTLTLAFEPARWPAL